jgi:cell division septation protein DedD
MSYDFSFDKKSVFLILGGSALIGVLLFFAGFVAGWDRGTYQARLDFEKQNAASNASLAQAKPPVDAVATPVALKSDTAGDAGGSTDDPPPATNDETQKTTTAPEPETAANSSASEPGKKEAKADPAPATQEKPAVQSSQKAPAPAPASSALDADKNSDASDDPSGFSLQIGAFQNEDNALRCVSSFKSRGYPVFVFHTLDAHGRTWHTVRIGHYPSVDKASAAAADFKGKERMPVFIRPVNEL